MSDQPRLLDLFCGAGGAAMGYHRAGFEVVGVDIKPQKRYPFEFHQADAMTFPLDGFDVIHASPPCQRYTALNGPHFDRNEHPDLVGATRRRLAGKTYIIENVPGSPLVRPFLICGAAMMLRLKRHRLFETNADVFGTMCCCCRGREIITVAGTGGRRKNRKRDDHGGACNNPRNVADAQDAMGIDWMTRKELSQAIPPAYTEWIGRQLVNRLQPKAGERSV